MQWYYIGKVGCSRGWGLLLGEWAVGDRRKLRDRGSVLTTLHVQVLGNRQSLVAELDTRVQVLGGSGGKQLITLISYIGSLVIPLLTYLLSPPDPPSSEVINEDDPRIRRRNNNGDARDCLAWP